MRREAWELMGGAWWIHWQDVQGLADKICYPDFHIFSTFSPNWHWINATAKSYQLSVFSAPWCEPEEWLYVIVKNFHTWGGRRQSDGVSLAVSNATLVSHLIVSLSAVRRSQPAAGPAHVQCVLSRAQNVQCKSALRGPVPCWRRRCRVVSMRRTGWAPPGLDTEPTRTSSAALYPDGGRKKTEPWNLLLATNCIWHDKSNIFNSFWSKEKKEPMTMTYFFSNVTGHENLTL